MKKIFIGGSRHISHLPQEVTNRLDEITKSRCEVLVGDANGVDKAVQRHLMKIGYESVTVFCSGFQPRNNVGHWSIHPVQTSKSQRGFQFYAEKDREMAKEADVGLMIWDGQSPGTLLNVLRLLRKEKSAVLINVKDQQRNNLKSLSDWKDFISNCSLSLLQSIEERATPEEWVPLSSSAQPELFTLSSLEKTFTEMTSAEDLSKNVLNDNRSKIETALKTGEDAFLLTLRELAEAQGIKSLAKAAKMTPRSVEKSLTSKTGIKLQTVIKLMHALGLDFAVTQAISAK